MEDLAKGGMAQVFVAQKDGAQEICVLKQLLDELETHATAGKRFHREAHVASFLQHPNIARILDAGLEDGTFCIAIEFIAGKDVESVMHHLMRQGRMLPYEVSIDVALRALDGLAYAHRATDPAGRALELVHRDLSPRNVMVSFDGQVKIIDFGLARGRIDDFRTAPGMILGTLRYASPEQAVADQVTSRSDLYSLSVVLYEMLTGRPLIGDGKPLEVLTQVVNTIPDRITARNEHLPRALDAVFARALAKDPEARFPTAEALSAALRAAAPELVGLEPGALGQFVASLFPADVDRSRRLMAEGRARFDATRNAALTGSASRSPLAPLEVPALDSDTLLDPASQTRAVSREAARAELLTTLPSGDDPGEWTRVDPSPGGPGEGPRRGMRATIVDPAEGRDASGRGPSVADLGLETRTGYVDWGPGGPQPTLRTVVKDPDSDTLIRPRGLADPDTRILLPPTPAPTAPSRWPLLAGLALTAAVGLLVVGGLWTGRDDEVRSGGAPEHAELVDPEPAAEIGAVRAALDPEPTHSPAPDPARPPRAAPRPSPTPARIEPEPSRPAPRPEPAPSAAQAAQAPTAQAREHALAGSLLGKARRLVSRYGASVSPTELSDEDRETLSNLTSDADQLARRVSDEKIRTRIRVGLDGAYQGRLEDLARALDELRNALP